MDRSRPARTLGDDRNGRRCRPSLLAHFESASVFRIFAEIASCDPLPAIATNERRQWSGPLEAIKFIGVRVTSGHVTVARRFRPDAAQNARKCYRPFFIACDRPPASPNKIKSTAKYTFDLSRE